MIGYRFTITNLWNNTTIVLNDTTTDANNFYGIEESPLNELDVRLSERDLAGRHGIKSFYTFYGGRALSFTGKIFASNKTQMEIMEAKLRKVFALPSFPTPSNNGNVLIKWTDYTGNNWQIYAKVTADVRTKDYFGGPRIKDYIVQLRSESPFIMSQLIYTDNAYRYYQGANFTLPTTLPAVISEAFINEEIVTVGGNYDTPPIFTIFGPSAGSVDVLNPKIYHVELNKFIKLDTTLTVGDYVVIDVERGTIIKNGTTDLSSTLTTDSEYFYLTPGTNTIRFTHEEDTPNNTGVPATEYVKVERRNAQV